MSKINSLAIDEHTEIFMGSDHAGLILEVEKEQSLDAEDAEEDESIYIPMNAKYLMDEALQDKTGVMPGENSYLQRTLVMLRGKAQDSLNINKHLNLWNEFVSVLI